MEFDTYLFNLTFQSGTSHGVQRFARQYFAYFEQIVHHRFSLEKYIVPAARDNLSITSSTASLITKLAKPRRPLGDTRNADRRSDVGVHNSRRPMSI